MYLVQWNLDDYTARVEKAIKTFLHQETKIQIKINLLKFPFLRVWIPTHKKMQLSSRWQQNWKLCHSQKTV